MKPLFFQQQLCNEIGQISQVMEHIEEMIKFQYVFHYFLGNI